MIKVTTERFGVNCKHGICIILANIGYSLYIGGDYSIILHGGRYSILKITIASSNIERSLYIIYNVIRRRRSLYIKVIVISFDTKRLFCSYGSYSEIRTECSLHSVRMTTVISKVCYKLELTIVLLNVDL